jgi:hypothetical protein
MLKPKVPSSQWNTIINNPFFLTILLLKIKVKKKEEKEDIYTLIFVG